MTYSTLPRRPVLDGMRGAAVTMVVTYHLRPQLLPGGFLGVDLFFVLSGFLISSLLLVEAEQRGTIDLARFYVRRVRRLAPAMLLMIAALAWYAAVWANPIELQRLRTHGIWAVLSLANWRFIRDGTTYTDVVAGASPLRHVWSLSIEEQFYAVLPVVVFLLCIFSGRHLRRRLMVGSLLLAATSVCWSAWLSFHGAEHGRTYFGTDTRAHALLIGVALGAALLGRPVPARHHHIAAAAALLGAFGLVIFAIAVEERSPELPRGGFAVVAICSACVIAGAEHLKPLRSLLTTRVLTGLGAISYGVYLWHWPVIVVIDAGRTGLPVGSVRLSTTQLAVTLALASASYVLVEIPIRSGSLNRRLGRVGSILALPGVTLAVVAGLTFATVLPTSTGDRSITAPADPGARPPADSTSTEPATTPPGAAASGVASPPTSAASAGTVTPPTIVNTTVLASPIRLVVMGDSVAHSLAGGTVLTFPDIAPWSRDQATIADMTSIARPGCSFLPGKFAVQGGDLTLDLSDFCGDWHVDLTAEIKSRRATHVAILLVNDMADREIDGRFVPFGSAEYQSELNAFLDETRSVTEAAGAALVLLVAAPRSAEFPDPEGERAPEMLAMLRAYADQHAITAISLAEAPSTTRFDGQHYSWTNGRLVLTWVVDQLRQSPTNAPASP